MGKGTNRWRILLFKTLSLLCYDDKLDEYRVNIRQSLVMINPGNHQNENPDKIIFDLIGICEGI